MSQMKTRTLGGTGIPVSEMALEAMMLGPMGNTERDESVAIIRAAGASMYPAELITEAQWVAERRGLHRLWTEQPRYSILNRTLRPPCSRRPSDSGWAC